QQRFSGIFRVDLAQGEELSSVADTGDQAEAGGDNITATCLCLSGWASSRPLGATQQPDCWNEHEAGDGGVKLEGLVENCDGKDERCGHRDNAGDGHNQ